MAERQQGGPRITKVVVCVHHAEDIDKDQVVKAINTMLDIGFGDAVDTASDEETTNEEAEVAASLGIDEPYAQE